MHLGSAELEYFCCGRESGSPCVPKVVHKYYGRAAQMPSGPIVLDHEIIGALWF